MMIESIVAAAGRETAHDLEKTAPGDRTQPDGRLAPIEGPAPGGSPGSDGVKVTPEAVQEILVRKSEEVLDKHLAKVKKERPEKHGHARSSPDRIAEKVLHKVTKRLEQAARQMQKIERNPEQRLAKVFHKLGQALTIALNETFKMLRNVQVEGGQGKRFIDDIAGPLFAGLERLPEEMSALASASISNERSFSMEVTTQEGDRVTIQVNSRAVASSSIELNRTEDGFSRQLGNEMLTEQSLSFRVEGELDAEEAEAIQQLIGGVESLSNSFYSGDLEAALQGAQALSFDSEEISGYSLNMQQTTQAEVIAAYSGAPAQLPGFTALDTGINDLVAGLNLEELFENVDAMIREMVAGALESHPQAPEGGGSGMNALAEAGREPLT